MTRATPVIGGVMDGDHVSLPKGAEAGYTARLVNDEQSTDYTLREDSFAGRAMVADGHKWPLLAAAGA